MTGSVCWDEREGTTLSLEKSVERELLGECRAGEPRSFEPIVAAYEGQALAVARGILGEEEAARDAVQDAFVRAYRALESFDPDRRFEPWFFRILRNRCRDLAREHAAREERERRHGRMADAVTGAGEDGREVQRRRERREAVHDALKQLDMEHREVLVFKEIHGMSYAEIAGVLGVPEGTIASRLSRARRALRSELEDAGVEIP